MTACVNKKHSRRVAAAVSASLVGALTLGAAPAVVFATEAPVEQQVAGDAFSRGDVALKGLTATDGVYSVKADPNGKALDIEATSVTPLGTSAIALPANGYTVEFYAADDDFEPTGTPLKSISEPGKYAVVVTAGTGTPYPGSKAVAKLNVKGASLSGINFYEVDPLDPYSTDDTTVTYTGGKLNIGFAVSGAYLVEGEDYTLKVLKEGTDNVETAPAVDIVESGNYVAYVTGIGQYAGETEEVPFTVARFNWANATIDPITVIGSDTKPAHPVKVTNGYQPDDDQYAELDSSLVSLAFVGGVDGDAKGSDLFDKTGKYEFKATVDQDNTSIKNSSGAKTVDVYKVAQEATFQYDGKSIQGSYLINIADGDDFNPSKLVVYCGDKRLEQGTDYTFTVNNGKYGEYTKLDNGTPGTYEVEISVLPGSSNVKYAAGGSVTFTVKVVKDVLDADATVYVYDNTTNQAITSYTKSYDGTKLWAGSQFAAKIFDKDGNEISHSAADIELELLDSEGNHINYAENAGSYILKVVSTNYELTGTTEIPVTIAKVDLSELKLFSLEEWGGAEYLKQKLDSSDKPQDYMWDEIDVRYNTGVADDDKTDTATDGKAWESLKQTADFKDLDKSLTLEKWDDEEDEWVKQSTSADKCKEEGLYRITVSGTKAQARNYTFANDDNTTSVEFRVVNPNKLVFTDVAPGSWYFESVYTAQYYKIMNGYSGTKVFGPASPITRGQVAVVLYNMAVGNPNSAELVDETKLSYNEVRGYDTGFDDVDGHAYYAKAIAWAEQAGVVNGYADGTFHADQEVTRQEFACMLANYAELLGEDVQGAEADLSGFADASQVAPFAEESVEWAVANKVMGNGGSIAPGAWISRAEAAAMAVNYAYAE